MAGPRRREDRPALSTYLATPVRHVFADQGFAGRLVEWTRDTLKITLEIVRKPADQLGFAVHPRRWVVERTLAWLTACRRLARDYERHPEVSEGIIRWAAIGGMARRITRGLKRDAGARRAPSRRLAARRNQPNTTPVLGRFRCTPRRHLDPRRTSTPF